LLTDAVIQPPTFWLKVGASATEGRLNASALPASGPPGTRVACEILVYYIRNTGTSFQGLSREGGAPRSIIVTKSYFPGPLRLVDYRALVLAQTGQCPVQVLGWLTVQVSGGLPEYPHAVTQGSGCFAKQSGLSLRLGEYSNVGSESGILKQNKPEVPPSESESASATFGAVCCRCWDFLVLAPACAALRIGLLLSALSRLTHILQAVLDGSNLDGNLPARKGCT
jgi:hypothetical protein